MRKIDLTGKRFGMLNVWKKDNHVHKDNRIYWICRCDCGAIKSYPTYRLTRKTNPARSCGCMSETASKRSGSLLKATEAAHSEDVDRMNSVERENERLKIQISTQQTTIHEQYEKIHF